MPTQVRSLKATRLEKLGADFDKLIAPYGPDSLLPRRRTLAARCEAAGRLLETLEGRIGNPARRALVMFCLIEALELLPLETVSENRYLEALNVWLRHRERRDSLPLRSMYQESKRLIARADSEFSLALEVFMCLRLSRSEAEAVRDYVAILAKATI